MSSVVSGGANPKYVIKLSTKADAINHEVTNHEAIVYEENIALGAHFMFWQIYKELIFWDFYFRYFCRFSLYFSSHEQIDRCYERYYDSRLRRGDALLNWSDPILSTIMAKKVKSLNELYILHSLKDLLIQKALSSFISNLLLPTATLRSGAFVL